MTSPRLLPSGPRAVLAEYDSVAQVMGVTAALGRANWPGLVDVVPAARTVLVVHDGSGLPDAVTALLRDPPVYAVERHTTVEIIVNYDGDDLLDVSQHSGLTIAEVVAEHCAPEYRVAFCGFVPGFSYLVGLSPRLHLPRRSTPRPSVPAGSVAIASEYSAVYPSATPGGWHLLGRTAAVLWDDDRDPPALLTPGTTVRFRPA